MTKICPHCGTEVELILDENCEPDVYHCKICQTNTPANLWMNFISITLKKWLIILDNTDKENHIYNYQEIADIADEIDLFLST